MKTRAKRAARPAGTKKVAAPEVSDTDVEIPVDVLEESGIAAEAPAEDPEERCISVEAPAKDSSESTTTIDSLAENCREGSTTVEAPPKNCEEGGTTAGAPAKNCEAESGTTAGAPTNSENEIPMCSIAADESAVGENIAAEALVGDRFRPISVSTQESVIVISDDDEADCTLGLGNSVLIIEESYEKSMLEEKRSEEVVLDEELAITFTRSGNVMPHARYDCTAHLFVRSEHDTSTPLENNADVCDQCYCYLCDKPALQCPYWTTVSICHCNAHNKSIFWKSQRDAALAGILTIFDLDLTEIDADLRQGGFLLLTFVHELTIEYNKYLMGTRMARDQFFPCTCVCHRGHMRSSVPCPPCTLYHTDIIIYSYSEVYKKVEEFLKKAEKEKPKSAAVILLGIVKELVFHKEPPLAHQVGDPSSSLRSATPILLRRILANLQKMLVLSGFPNTLCDKFIRFFQSLPLPPHCYCFSNCLNVLPWDDLFLITILLGQNITGHRTRKGKKEFLCEAISVIQARVQKLEDEGNYKHLVRYLKAVRCNDMLPLQRLREKIPFYMCKYGNFPEAAQSLVQLKCASCTVNVKLSVADFALYLKMFRTECCPSGKYLTDQEEWTSLKGNVLKRGVLIKLILRILYVNPPLLESHKCWSTLIQTWCSGPILGPKGQLGPIAYPEPNLDFQRSVMDIAFPILEELRRQTHVNLPQPFSVMPNEAELILIVRAFAQKLLFDPKPPASVLSIILAFGKNTWALRDLLEAITPRNDLVYQFTQKLADELCVQKQTALHAWSLNGSQYICDLIYTFLMHLNMLVRSVGFHMLDILIENFHMLPWSQQVACFLQNKVSSSCIFFTPAERNELKKKIEVCQARR
ncbi:uncharacterized protein LOC144785991 isoform X2 [Lissotriton helveticus]